MARVPALPLSAAATYLSGDQRPVCILLSLVTSCYLERQSLPALRRAERELAVKKGSFGDMSGKRMI